MIVTFGKHKNRTCEWVVENEPDYAEWVIDTANGGDARPGFVRVAREMARLLGVEPPGGDEFETRGRAPPAPPPKPQERSWWEVLECDRHADPAAVKAAWRKQCSLYHPDKVASLGRELQELANRKMQEIQRAYDDAQCPF